MLLLAACRRGALAQVQSMKEEIAAATKIQAAKRGKDARAQVRSQRVAAAEAAEAAEAAAARARQQADAWAREAREAESKAREVKLAAAELALAERIQAAEIARRSVSQSPSTRALATPAESPIVLLRQLKRLLDDGLITPKQFEVKREELLARWVNGNR